jgi:ABC-2 type transport system permease protein
MNRRAFLKLLKTETKLYIRGFFGPFFSLAFPLMMIILFGNIYGNSPSEFFNGRGAMDREVPALIALIIAVNGIMTLPLTLSEYQSSKAYKRFDASPVSKNGVICAQVVVYMLSTVIGTAVMLIYGKLAYNITITGQWYAIIPAFLLSVFSIFSIGFFIASVFSNAKASQLVSYLLYFIMMFLSGATMPSEMFPAGVKTFSKILPLTHAVQLSQNTFEGAPIGDSLFAILVLSATLVVCGAVGAIMYRRRRWA